MDSMDSVDTSFKINKLRCPPLIARYGQNRYEYGQNAKVSTPKQEVWTVTVVIDIGVI